MLLSKINETGLVNDQTDIILRNDFKLVACGKWNDENIAKYYSVSVESFTWQEDNSIYVDLILF